MFLLFSFWLILSILALALVLTGCLKKEITTGDTGEGAASDVNQQEQAADTEKDLIADSSSQTSVEETCETYRDIDNGFEVKCPQGWGVNEGGVSTSIIPRGVDTGSTLLEGVSITVREKTLKELLNEDVLTDPYSQPQKFKKWRDLHEDLKEITINKFSGIQFEEISAWHGGDQVSFYIILSLGDKIIEFRSGIPQKERLMDIVESFKVIE